jgi:hypothetical protein
MRKLIILVCLSVCVYLCSGETYAVGFARVSGTCTNDLRYGEPVLWTRTTHSDVLCTTDRITWHRVVLRSLTDKRCATTVGGASIDVLRILDFESSERGLHPDLQALLAQTELTKMRLRRCPYAFFDRTIDDGLRWLTGDDDLHTGQSLVRMSVFHHTYNWTKVEYASLIPSILAERNKEREIAHTVDTWRFSWVF